MKIRNGFVSNSSSSSFLIYGVSFSSTDELLDALGLDEGDMWDVGENAANELGLELECPYSGDYGCYIGASWDSIGDDETGAQFKAKIEKKLKEKFGDDIELSTHSEAWHDG